LLPVKATLVNTQMSTRMVHAMTFGESMRALMAERDISLRTLAKSIPADVGHLSKISRDLRLPSEQMAERIDAVLGAGGALAALSRRSDGPQLREARLASPGLRLPITAASAVELAAWIEGTNVGEATLAFLDQETRRLRFDYARGRPADVTAEASELLQQVTALLRESRQRLAQTCALFRNASELLALLCLLADDVGNYGAARAYGLTAWTCAEEADSDLHRALVLSAQSKTAKWEERFREAAEFARRGYEYSPPTEARILLASQEANALQALGDLESAGEALTRSRRARDDLAEGDAPGSAWACPRPRQATYALQVALGAGDPAWMLREVDAADTAWNEGDPWVYGTWSQIRIGASLAHAMNGEVEGVAEELASVLELPPELRVVTITGRIGAVEQQVNGRQYAGSPVAEELREQIRGFRAGALPQRQIAATEDS
jgi:transcriptional regulator with XRE-family HTH domain